MEASMIPSSLAVSDHRYSLSHLAGGLIRLVQPARDGRPDRIYPVTVIYTNHVYSREIKPGDNQSIELKDSYGNGRIFDYERYFASYELPRIIENLSNMTIYHAKEDFMVISEAITPDGRTLDYGVFFKTYLSNNRTLTLRVKSAYTNDRGDLYKNTNGKISIFTLLHNTMNGKSIKSCPR